MGSHVSPLIRVGTGCEGLDEILEGGLPADRLYLVQGDPGVGKTTLGLQFLLEGVERGERVLYITLSETGEEIAATARSHGWSLEGVSLYELSALEQQRSLCDQGVMFDPADIELPETAKLLLVEVDRVKPTRVVFDSLSELRLLAQSSLRYRRQILSLKQHFVGNRCTVLLLDDKTSQGEDLHLQSIVHGVVDLEQLAPVYGGHRRRLRVRKIRGSSFVGGYHDYRIKAGGLAVYPRLVAADHRSERSTQQISSGLPALDSLVGGGIDRGTATLFLGPAGSGKSALASQYAVAAARRGEHATVFLFDEAISTYLLRSERLGLGVGELVDRGLIHLKQIDPAEMSPGEFTSNVRYEVEQKKSQVVVIDSLTGYLNAMPEERFLLIQMHELQLYLNQKGVTTFLVMAQHGLLGQTQTTIDVSYLADSVLLLRFFEDRGHVFKALSVVKRRTGPHENTIRQLAFSPEGIHVGRPLTDLHGVLTGAPQYVIPTRAHGPEDGGEREP